MQAVYEEDLLHRRPGLGEPLPFEAGFPAAKDWIQQEAHAPDQEDIAKSFTRIVIGDLKPEILQNVEKIAGREQLCRCALPSLLEITTTLQQVWSCIA